MKIKEILSQNRRDFTAIYVCEHCGEEHTSSGYDDRNFHEKVIPDMPCKVCGKRAPGGYVPMPTKYPDSKVV